ncbi:MAG: recombinase family protein [Methanomassiliicoccaceae archaeon]|nr:recombinase family protein [Methanomassiliicoccaceae archaeon]
MRAALYVRVSTEDQAKEGLSLDTQIEQLKVHCEINNWEISDIYRDEGYSCRNTDRPGYKRMMDDSDKWDVLLVMKMNRIHCNSANFKLMMDDLRDRGKGFASTQETFDTTTPIGRFVMDIIRRIAQLESEQ